MIDKRLLMFDSRLSDTFPLETKSFSHPSSLKEYIVLHVIIVGYGYGRRSRRGYGYR